MPPSRIVRNVVELMKNIGEEDKSDVLEPFKLKARWVARSMGPFLDLHNAFYAGMPTEDDDVTPEDQAIFDRLLALHPNFPELVSAFKNELDAFDNFVATMVANMRDARSSDSNMIKYNIIEWIPQDPKIDSVQPPIIGSKKDSRGWYHSATALALTPLSRVDEFSANPLLFRNKVQNGTIRVGAHDFPTFLYPDGTMYDPENPEAGLFRGHILLRVLRAIYTGRSSALDGYRSASRSSLAEIHGVRDVFPEMVAYAAVQAHFGLSSLENWSEIENGDFNYVLFFQNCVRLLKDTPDDEWVSDTLKFLTSQLPSLRRKRKLANNDADDNDQGEDQTSRILALRAERNEARRRAAETAAENQNRPPEHPSTPPPSSPPPSSSSRSPRGHLPLGSRRPLAQVQPRSSSPGNSQSPHSPASELQHTQPILAHRLPAPSPQRSLSGPAPALPRIASTFQRSDVTGAGHFRVIQPATQASGSGSGKAPASRSTPPTVELNQEQDEEEEEVPVPPRASRRGRPSNRRARGRR